MSLLKTNEIQNYNGSSLTLTASTVSTSAQLNTGGNISVTGSLNVSDDSTTRTNLGLGTIATQDSDSITVTGGTATLSALTVSGSDSGDLVRITQTGSGNALVVEDSANPDSTPFVVDANGNVGIGRYLLIQKEDFTDYGVSNNAGVVIHQEQGTNIPNLSISGDSNSSALLAYSLYSNTAGQYQFYVSYDGEVNYRGLNSLSDIRDKQNISKIDIGLEEVIRLKPKSFQWLNNEEDSYNYGFIAQEVSEVIPSIVNERKYNDLETRFGISMDQLIPILTKAIQEQQTLIESQQSQIDALTARIVDLETT